MDLLQPQSDATRFRPPAPEPLQRPPDLFDFLVGVRRNPLTTWSRDHFAKPIVATAGALGRITILNDPAAIRYVLVENAGNYRKDDLQRRVLAPGLGEGLLTVEGEAWRVQRRALAPLFSPRNVAEFTPAMAEAGDKMLRRWARRDGRVLDVALEMTRVTLDVLERTIFTAGLQRDPDALSRAISRYFEALGPIDPLDVFGLPGWLPRVGRIRARPAIRFFAEVVGELTEDRKRLLEGGGEAPRDLLTLLLQASDPETGKGLSDLEVQANIVTFIGAGHETTANTLSWALYLLSQAPEIRARVEAEADAIVGDSFAAGQEYDRLVWTRAVVEEAMRLYPPVPYLSRAAIRDDRVAGFRIPAGSLVAIAPYVLHRHRLLWEEPDLFDPARFLPERRAAIDRFAYLPFGAGPRICIGASFSVQEALIVLAAVLRAVRLDPAPGHAVRPIHRVTLRPEGGMPMRATRRGAA